jgi:uncharacterized protein involved in outer membrane biogenesis
MPELDPPKSAGNAATPPLKRKPRWRWPLALLAVIALYAMAGFFGVPRLAARIAHQQVDKIGHKLELGALSFNPFTFEARINALRLTEADGAPLIAFDDLDVDLAVWRSIADRGLVLKSVKLSAPDISIVVNADGTINLAQLVPPSPKDKPPKPDSAPPKIIVTDLTIERGRVALEDRSRPQPFHVALSPIEFHLADFRTEKQHESGYAFKAAASSGEVLEWTGDFCVQPLGSKGKFSLKGLKASTLTSYLQDQLPVGLASGIADIGGDYTLTAGDTLSLDVHLPAVTLRDFALADTGKNKTAPPLSLAELSIVGTQISLQQREVKIDRVDLKRLHADVLREADGSLNLSRLMAPQSDQSKSATPPIKTPTVVASSTAPAVATKPWRVAVGRVALADVSAHVEDRSVTPIVRLDLAGGTVSVTGLSTDAAASPHVEAAIGIGANGHASVQGDIKMQPLNAQAALDVQNVDLSILQPYLTPHTGLALKSGALGANGRLTFDKSAGGDARFAFTGLATLAKLDLQDRASGQDLLGWDQIKVGGIDFKSAPQSLHIARVDLAGPFAQVEISPQRQINIANALKAPDAPPPIQAKPAANNAAPVAANAQPTSPMPIRVDTIHVDDGKLRFTDRSIDPNFNAAIFALAGDITRVSSDPKTQTKIHLEGKVDQFAPVIISGAIVPAAYANDTDITMSFRNMDLVRFNPYSGRFAGYNIVKGKLTTDLHYKIHDRALDANHHIVLDQLEFGDATGSKDAVPLPVKLAVALLKDRNGVIDLSLPVNGSLDDPTFRVAPVLWKVVVNALTKAVTAPFSALASLIGGGDSEELAYVEFAAGASDLSDAETQKLAKLAAALVERPQLKLDVPVAEDDTQDRQALAKQVLDQRVPPAAADVDPEKARKTRIDALEKLHKQLLGASPDYPKMDDVAKGEAREQAKLAFLESALLPKLGIDDDALQKLAAQRARSVIAALVANPQIQPERIFQSARKAASVTPAGSVRMELQLQ